MPKITVKTAILNNLADTYDDVYKTIAEFVDNAIDASEEWYSLESRSYSKPIKIEVSFIGSKKGTAQVAIKDNCKGMDKLEIERIFQSIGDSNKKHGTFSNGKFGFGIFSFSAFFDTISIESMMKGTSDPHKVQISRSILDSNEPTFDVNPISKQSFSSFEHGTIVLLRGYRKKNWKNISKDKLIDYLNNHFERYLAAKNLEITITDKKGSKTLKPFDYTNIDGESLIENIQGVNGPKIEFYTVKPSQTNSLINGPLVQGIDSHFKITKSIVGKPFFIAIKGRRIGDVKHAITSTRKLDNSIWAHPLLTGYLDLDGFADPDITRTKIKAGDRKNSVIEYLQRKEKDIKELLDTRNKQNEDRSWGDTANEINEILKNMTKEYNVMFSQLSGATGKEVGTGGSEGGARIKAGGKKKIKESSPTDGPGDGLGSGGTGPLGEDLFSDEISNKPKKTSLQISFIPGLPMTKTDLRTGKKVEISSSLQEDGMLVFYTEHIDFKSRVKISKGSKIITQRLGTFLGVRIGVHFLDKYFTKGKETLDYSTSQLEDNGNFILKFESYMQPLINRSIDKIGKDES
jgi:hypothetical protein